MVVKRYVEYKVGKPDPSTPVAEVTFAQDDSSLPIGMAAAPAFIHKLGGFR
jgi:hypothetical protein